MEMCRLSRGDNNKVDIYYEHVVSKPQVKEDVPDLIEFTPNSAPMEQVPNSMSNTPTKATQRVKLCYPNHHQSPNQHPTTNQNQVRIPFPIQHMNSKKHFSPSPYPIQHQKPKLAPSPLSIYHQKLELPPSPQMNNPNPNQIKSKLP
ncbi:hypothetical protein PIB30_069267 [Stylosanthes scabra]|uniref:Uncharacterized protein n=1 Tax=Stylosanthes scabra TaxID=79078 RepID=A0ABU6ULX4_9FABA|nr:hypothetical protein [Stylosanthes scabra]